MPRTNVQGTKAPKGKNSAKKAATSDASSSSTSSATSKPDAAFKVKQNIQKLAEESLAVSGGVRAKTATDAALKQKEGEVASLSKMNREDPNFLSQLNNLMIWAAEHQNAGEISTKISSLVYESVAKSTSALDATALFNTILSELRTVRAFAQSALDFQSQLRTIIHTEVMFIIMQVLKDPNVNSWWETPIKQIATRVFSEHKYFATLPILEVLKHAKEEGKLLVVDEAELLVLARTPRVATVMSGQFTQLRSKLAGEVRSALHVLLSVRLRDYNRSVRGNKKRSRDSMESDDQDQFEEPSEEKSTIDYSSLQRESFHPFMKEALAKAKLRSFEAICLASLQRKKGKKVFDKYKKKHESQSSAPAAKRQKVSNRSATEDDDEDDEDEETDVGANLQKMPSPLKMNEDWDDREVEVTSLSDLAYAIVVGRYFLVGKPVTCGTEPHDLYRYYLDRLKECFNTTDSDYVPTEEKLKSAVETLEHLHEDDEDKEDKEGEDSMHIDGQDAGSSTAAQKDRSKPAAATSSVALRTAKVSGAALSATKTRDEDTLATWELGISGLTGDDAGELFDSIDESMLANILSDGRNFLHWLAANWKKPALWKLLLAEKRGQDWANGTDKSGRLPVWIATQHVNPVAVVELSRYTPLRGVEWAGTNLAHAAAEAIPDQDPRELEGMLQLLIQAGVAFDKSNTRGVKPNGIARARKHYEDVWKAVVVSRKQ